MWCVLGCAIGDFGTILFFQLTQIPFPLLGIMILAIINGLITSIILETFILIRQNFTFINALKTASGMSLISMLSMEIMMNLTDYILTGGGIGAFTGLVAPHFLYNEDGSLRQFGIGYKKKTVIPNWLVALVLAIFSYFIVIFVYDLQGKWF